MTIDYNFGQSVGGRLNYQFGEPVWDFGWIRPEIRTDAEHQADRAARQLMPKFTIEGTKRDDSKFVNLMALWKHPKVVEANGWEFTGTHQLTGSCVGAAGGNVLMTLACADAVLRNEAETPLLPFWLLPYGRSRYYSGSRSPGEGSQGTTFARAAREDGVIEAKRDGLPSFTRTDGFVWGSRVEMAWSDGDAQQTMDLLPESRKHLCGTTASCRDHNDVREAIKNLYPCTCASMYAHDGGKLQSDPQVSVGTRRGQWSHQMAFLAWWDHPKLGELFWLMNQWGLKAHTFDPTMGTGAGAWIKPADVDYICRDEVFAFSQYTGFPSQTLDFFWG